MSEDATTRADGVDGADDATDTDGECEGDDGDGDGDGQSIRIELASGDDVDDVVDLWVALADEQLAHGSHVRADTNREAIREILSVYHVSDGLLVARDGDAIVGFATFTVEHGTLDLDVRRGVLSNLYVRPPWRGRGIGTELLEAATAALTARDVTVVSLEVLAANDRARRFYRENGYDPQRMVMERSLEPREDRSDTHTKEGG